MTSDAISFGGGVALPESDDQHANLPAWKSSSLPPAPAASRLTKARILAAQGCCVMNPWLACKRQNK